MSDAQPKLSEDGKFYWDGERWVPLPASGSAPEVRVRGTVRTAPARWRYVFWTLLIGGILAFIVWSFMSR